MINEENTTIIEAGEDFRSLAHHLAAVLKHPRCPGRLFNMINDFISDKAAPVYAEMVETPSGIARILDASADERK